MRRMLFVGTLAILALGVTPGGAGASPGDFAAGGGHDGVGHFNFSAHQGATFQASGHMSYRSPTQEVRADVVCLAVEGNQAFVLGQIDPSKSSGTPEGATRVAFEAKDERGADGLSVFFASPVLGCQLPTFTGAPIARGNVVIHDNLP